jgi:phage terminase large subunit-like protein
MTGGRTSLIVKACEHAQSAIVERQMTHDGDFLLTRHVLNSRTVDTPSGLMIAKEFPDSTRKIDGAVAMVLALWARQEGIAKGFDRERPKRRSFGF